MAKLRITLVKSTAGRKANQIATVKALGLKKIGDYSIGQNTPALLGKVKVLRHLVKVEPVSTVTE